MIEKNDTWKLVGSPEDKDVFAVKWVYKTKLNVNGSIHKHKVRLMARTLAKTRYLLH